MLTSSELSAPEEKETSGNVLDVKITNFGPISKGRISLRPLTILMGPNNSGKSYAAILVHSVMNAMSYVPDTDSNIPVDRIVKGCENAYKNGKRSLSLSPDMVAKINDAIRETTERRLERRLERNFELDLDDLIQLGAKEATIEIKTKFTHTDIRLTKTDHHFVATDDVLSSVEINLEKGRDGIEHQLIGGKLFIRHPRMEDRTYKTTFRISLHTLSGMGDFFRPFRSIYFPAERSGLVKRYKILFQSIAERGLNTERDRAKNSDLSTVTTDFLFGLLGMEKAEGKYASIAGSWERESVRGNIRIEPRGGVSEIKYLYGGKDMPLGAVSSSISELAPIILYLKHSVQQGNLLIIEEPETSLDPNNQRILAKFLVRLIRRGLRVMITTHSPFILEQLSNFLQADAITSGERSKDLGYDEDDYVKLDEVSAYSFEPTGGTGYEIRPVEVVREGISQENFIKVQDQMYEESYTLEKKIARD